MKMMKLLNALPILSLFLIANIYKFSPLVSNRANQFRTVIQKNTLSSSYILASVILSCILNPVKSNEFTSSSSNEDGVQDGSQNEAAGNKEEAAPTVTKSTTPRSTFEKLFGETLYGWGVAQDNEGKEEVAVYEVSTQNALKNKKVIGLYFSASWCGPCKQFTPVLANFYKEMNKKDPNNFEIVWVSHDQTSEDFFEYYQHMPWLALPIPSIPSLGNALGSKYKVKGIPHLVLLDGDDASVYTLEGRAKILQDKYGVEFPYKPRTVWNMLPRPLRRFTSSVLVSVKGRVLNIFRSILEGFVPKRILEFLFKGK